MPRLNVDKPHWEYVEKTVYEGVLCTVYDAFSHSSMGGAQSTRIVQVKDFNLDTAKIDGVVWYQTCTAERMHMGDSILRLHKPSNLGPKTYIGMPIEQDDLVAHEMDGKWRDLWPKRYQPTRPLGYYLSLLSQHESAMGVITRYGHVYALEEGESIEPVPFQRPGEKAVITTMHKREDGGYDSREEKSENTR